MNKKWLLGFIEGSGCFSIVIRKSNNKIGYQTIADFTIKLPKTQKSLLEEIQSFLSLGKIYETHGQSILKSTSLEDARRLSDFLSEDEFVSAPKRREFESWKACVSMMSDNLHHTPEGILKIAHLRDSIHTKHLWNKKNYCNLRLEIDPCHIYQESHSLPSNCRICWTGKSKTGLLESSHVSAKTPHHLLKVIS